MSFESLANELVICIFDYLDFGSIFNGFNLLNKRYSDLVNDYPKYYLNLRRISKSKLRNLLENDLPSLKGCQIFSLKIYDDEETPNISSLVNFDQFIYLKSIKIGQISAWPAIISKLIDLENLDIFRSHSELDENEQVEAIWKLSKLKSINIDESLRNGRCFANLKTNSASIEKICLENFYLNLDDLSNLFLRTPCLRFLTVDLLQQNDKICFALPKNNLISLNFSFMGSFKILDNLFENLSNLRALTIRLSNQIHFGQQFEELIRKYLPLLQRFQLKLSFEYRNFNENQTLIDRLIDSYLTPFWTIEHQWFFQCDWDPQSTQTNFYTIPYAFKDFDMSYLHNMKSTKVSTSKSIFRNVHHLRSTNIGDKFHSNRCFEFPSIKTLEIVLPCSEQLLQNFHKLHQLHTLDFTTINDSPFTNQLQTLLDHAINLYQLKFSHINSFSASLFHLRNSAIQRLDFSDKESMIFYWYFDEALCAQLVQSSIGQQCQVLVIDLKSVQLVFLLLKNMPNLRSLTFHAADDKSYRSASSGKADVILDFLRDELSANYSINRDKDSSTFIHIWTDI